MKKLGWRVVVIVVLLAAGMLACRFGWEGGCGGEDASEIHATETFGAAQFHAQLTEAAR